MQRWKQQQEDAEKAKVKAVRKVNGGALAASMFIPGLGQMLKGNYGEGSLTLIGEGALIGGGVAMLMLSNKQKTIMQDASGTLSYDDYSSAKSKYNTYRYTSYGLFGAAAILYGVNLWRAWACKDKRVRNLQSFYPMVMPEQNGGLAFGVGMTMNF